MECPKCNGHLEVRWLDDVEVEQCNECYGMWLDLGELPALRRKKHRQFSRETSETVTLNQKMAQCPCCGGEGRMTRLHDLKRPEVMIDSCAVCYGIWLDGGELEKLTETNVLLAFKDLVRDLLN